MNSKIRIVAMVGQICPPTAGQIVEHDTWSCLALQQSIDEVAADESRPACDQDFLDSLRALGGVSSRRPVRLVTGGLN